MKTLPIKFILFIVLGLGLFTACEFSASTANIANATLAKDEAGTQPTTVFAQPETFYLVVDLANAPDDTTVKASWYAVDVGDVAPPNTLIDEAELTTGTNILFFNLAPESLWAVGDYKVEIYLNDELERTLTFEVQ
jgi:hypothetical protein